MSDPNPEDNLQARPRTAVVKKLTRRIFELSQTWGKGKKSRKRKRTPVKII